MGLGLLGLQGPAWRAQSAKMLSRRLQVRIYIHVVLTIPISEILTLEGELCSIWTNASQECSGLPYKVFRNIVDYSKCGVTYICTSCRLQRDKANKSSGSDNNKFTQLFETVKGLSSAVTKLSIEIESLKSQLNANDTIISLALSSHSLYVLIDPQAPGINNFSPLSELNSTSTTFSVVTYKLYKLHVNEKEVTNSKTGAT
ncbi:hypothetical protein E2C01_042440 [Portunus trituberculatus]|uniref:Uncharacterized protein n=1 Tax=Portunus trituberculatus TaxID=210409 RepID=A0A5B7FUT7_PORTR|nr:hypothetical protein [Portunus trituberculatus]